MSTKLKSFSIKAMDEQSEYQFEGYASTFRNTDRDGDIFEKGVFDETLKKKSTVPLLFNHDRNTVIGKLDLYIDDIGLMARGYLNMKDPKAQNIYDLMKMGALDGLSIGFSVKDYEPINLNKPFGGWKVKKAELYEVSVVTIPANDKALIQNVKSFDDADEKTKGWFYNLIKKAVEDAFRNESRRKELLEKIQRIERNGE